MDKPVKSSTPNPFRNFEKMIAFLEEALPEEEMRQFEKFLEEDEEFADRFDELHKAWLLNPNLKQDVTMFHEELFTLLKSQARESPGNKGKEGNLKSFIFFGIGILLLVIFIIWRGTEQSDCSFEDIPSVAKEASLYSQQYTTMGTGAPASNTTDSIIQGFVNYDSQNYEEAVEIFLKQIDTTQTTLVMREMTLCLAVSFIMVGEESKALPYLRRVQVFEEPRYTLEAEWYLALIKLAGGNYNEAKIYLQKVIDKGSPYENSASMLLECLSNWSD